MAVELAGLDLSMTAENSLAALQFHAVEMSGNFQVSDCDGTTDQVIGVLQNKPVAGAAAQVRVAGVTKWVSDGSVTAAGMLVGTDGTGLATAKTTDKDKIAGISLDGSSTTGDVVTVLLTIGNCLSKT